MLAEIGLLWRPLIDIGARGILVKKNEIFAHLFREITESEWWVNRSSWNGEHLFLLENGVGPFVTDVGKQILSKYSGEWIRYLPTR